MYYLVASATHSIDCLFDALVVIARNESNVSLTVLHGDATSSGRVITITGLAWYSNVICIELIYNG